MTARGKAESTEEAAVYVNELDVFVTMMLLEGSPATQSLGYFANKSATTMSGKRRRSPSLLNMER